MIKIIRIFLILSIACIMGCADDYAGPLIDLQEYEAREFTISGKVDGIHYYRADSGKYHISGLTINKDDILLDVLYGVREIKHHEFVTINVLGEFKDGSYFGEIVDND